MGLAGVAAAQDDFARLTAARAAATKRNRLVYGLIAVLAIGYFGWKWTQDARHKAEAQAKLDFAEKWVELEKRETGLFWNCVVAGEVDVGMFSNTTQVQGRIEAAYATQQKGFSDYLLTECIPKMERARQAFAGLAGAPEELKAPLDAYLQTLPALQKGIELYATRIKNRGSTKDLDQLIQEYGNAWNAETKPTPETIAYEKFLYCSVPGLDKMKDIQDVLEFLADSCFKKDPVKFMDHVRKDCGSLLTNVDPKAVAPKTYKASQKKFYEEDGRQFQAWDSCSRKSRKGKKVEDLGDFLTAVGNYMTARAKFVATARDAAAAAAK